MSDLVGNPEDSFFHVAAHIQYFKTLSVVLLAKQTGFNLTWSETPQTVFSMWLVSYLFHLISTCLLIVGFNIVIKCGGFTLPVGPDIMCQWFKLMITLFKSH